MVALGTAFALCWLIWLHLEQHLLYVGSYAWLHLAQPLLKYVGSYMVVLNLLSLSFILAHMVALETDFTLCWPLFYVGCTWLYSILLYVASYGCISLA